MDNNKNILFGGTVRLDIEQTVQSLGEHILKELANHGDKVALVRLLSLSLSIKKI